MAIVGRSVNSLSKDVVIMKRHHLRNDLKFFESMLKGKYKLNYLFNIGCIVLYLEEKSVNMFNIV